MTPADQVADTAEHLLIREYLTQIRDADPDDFGGPADLAAARTLAAQYEQVRAERDGLRRHAVRTRSDVDAERLITAAAAARLDEVTRERDRLAGQVQRVRDLLVWRNSVGQVDLHDSKAVKVGEIRRALDGASIEDARAALDGGAA